MSNKVYAFRRRGQDQFCTCDETRYLELADKPRLFEVKVFYKEPPTAIGHVRMNPGFKSGLFQSCEKPPGWPDAVPVRNAVSTGRLSTALSSAQAVLGTNGAGYETVCISPDKWKELVESIKEIL